MHVAGYLQSQTGRPPGRHRPRDPAARRKSRLQRGARILRPRHRQDLPRGTAGAALRPPRHAGRTEGRHDLHHRTDDQRRPPRHPRNERRLDHQNQGPSPVAQLEHTILVTETGYEVLTMSAGTPPPPAALMPAEHAAAVAASAALSAAAAVAA